MTPTPPSILWRICSMVPSSLLEDTSEILLDLFGRRGKHLCPEPCVLRPNEIVRFAARVPTRARRHTGHFRELEEYAAGTFDRVLEAHPTLHLSGEIADVLTRAESVDFAEPVRNRFVGVVRR